MDRISSLPNQIICRIVSFLSANEAVFASVLSKRWLNLFTIISNVEFNDSIQFMGSLSDFLDRVLALPRSSRIRNFSLKCRKSVSPSHYAHINLCLRNVLKRGVLNLKLKIKVEEGYSLPFEVFTCNTLVELKLGYSLKIDFLPRNALLPALRTLTIDSVRFYDHFGCVFEKLLCACPILVELVMRKVEWEKWEWSRKISSPTLQRLTINHKHFIGMGKYHLESITFDIPSLTYLDYDGFVPDAYPIVNLDSVVEAKLILLLKVDDICMGEYIRGDGLNTSDPTNLIKGLQNVEILNLVSTETTEVFYFFREAIPVFKKLHHLTFASDDELCWKALPYVLKSAPNLNTLVIRGPLHYNYNNMWEDEKDDDDDDDDVDDDDDDENDELVCECLSDYDFLLSCPVKVLEITEYGGSKGELEQMKHFLEKLKCLELVKVHSCATKKMEKFQLRADLEKLRRSFKCKIEFEFVPESSTLAWKLFSV